MKWTPSLRWACSGLAKTLAVPWLCGMLSLGGFACSPPHAAYSESHPSPQLTKTVSPSDPPQHPMLRLENGGHIEDISRLSLDTANHYLVTGSKDKTVRIWNIQTKQLAKVLRPPIGHGHEGKIFAVAMSPNGQTIAAGGWTGVSWDRSYALYLFNRKSGDLIKKISNLPSSIGDVEFSPDGKMLVVGLHGGTGFHIYRTSDYALIAYDQSFLPTSYVYGIAFDQKGRFAISSYDGFIRLYDHDFQPRGKTRPPGGKRPYGLAFSSDGTHLAVGYEDSAHVTVLSTEDLAPTDFQPHNPPPSKGTFSSVAWSQEGHTLFAAGTARKSGKHFIRKWEISKSDQFLDIPVSPNTILDLTILKSGGIGFSAASGTFGILNTEGETTFASKVTVADYRDIGENLLLSPDGSSVQFGFAQFAKNPAQFSIASRVLLIPPSSHSTLHSPLQSVPNLSVENWKNSRTPTLNGKSLDLDQYEVSRSMAIAPHHESVLLGTSWNLRLFDRKGEELWHTPIPENAWGVNISQDNEIALATLGDGTIRWYRLRDGRELLALFPDPKTENWIMWTPSGYYDTAPGAEHLIGWHKNYGGDYSADFFPISRFRTLSYRPDIIENLILTWDEKEALRLAEARKSQTVGKPKTVAPPLLQNVKMRQQKMESTIANLLQKEQGQTAHTSSENLETLLVQHPPEIMILSPTGPITTSDPMVHIQYAVVTHPKAPADGISVFIDGQPISAARGIQVLGAISSDQPYQSIDVPIPAKNCTITLRAKTRWATSPPAEVVVKWDEQAAKPNLYVLAIGMDYSHDPTIQVPTSASDAESFGTTIEGQANRLYQDVKVKIYLNESATKGNLLDGLDWLTQETTQKDMAMLFVSGHAVTDKGGFPYLLTHQSHLDHLRRTSLALSEMSNAVTATAGKTILFLDLCQVNTPVGTSGCIQGVNSLSQDLGFSANGTVAFLASSGTQRAIYKPTWEHSSFTTALLEGLTGQTDLTASGVITVNRLSLHIAERVKTLTQGYQRPTTIKPQTIQDFPVALSPEGIPDEMGHSLGTSPIAIPVPAEEILNRLPPVITILSPPNFHRTSSQNLTLTYRVRNQSGEPVTEVMALIDGRPAPKARGIQVIEGKHPPGGTQQYSLTLPPHDTTISLFAKNQWATSEPASIRVMWDGERRSSAQKPTLNVLAIGISTYADSTLSLEFASKDAQDFSKILRSQIGGLYEHVNVKLLTDKSATKDDILEGLDWIDHHTTSSDVAMIFLAGHGVNDSGGKYYFLPVDADTHRLRRTALPYSDLKNTVATLSGKTLLFVDSCHAGDVMGARRGVADINALVNELTSAENGAVVFASSTGRQFALEDSKWGNGAFTKALIEGLEGQADFGKDGTITVNRLDLYLSERVKALTEGRQTPTTTKPKTIQDFPIAVTNLAGNS